MSETTNLGLFKHDNPSTNTNQFNVENALNNNWDKIDEFAGDVSGQLDALQQSRETLENKVEVLETDNITNKSDITLLKERITDLEDYQDSMLPDGQASGEDITINDSAKYPCKIEVGGNSWQEASKQGKNLFNGFFENGFINSAGEITVSDTSVTSRDYIEVEANKKVCFSNNGVATSVNIAQYNLDGSFVGIVATANNYTFTEKCLIKFYRNNTSVDKFQVEYDAVTQYEAFTPDSPSTKYPSNLEAVGDSESLKVTVSNKNLCYESRVQNYSNIRFYFNPRLITKSFVISFIVNSDLNSNSLYLNYGGSENPRVAQITAAANTKVVQSITLTDSVYNALENSKAAYFLLYKGNAGFTEVREAMIVNGTDTSETYIAHEEQNAVFPFAEGQRLLKNCKLGDTGIIQNRKRIVCDGTENWTANATSSSTGGKFRWRLEVADIKQIDANTLADIQCTHYKAVKAGTDGTYQGVEGIATQNENITIFDPNYATAIATEWKAYVAQQYENGTPIEIEYELAEPETVAYTEAQKTAKAEIDKLTTYKGVTYITTDSKAILDVNYKKDLEILINNINNAIVEGS